MTAEYHIGDMHHKREFLSQYYSKTAYWYLNAAEKGRIEVQYNLGELYSNSVIA